MPAARSAALQEEDVRISLVPVHDGPVDWRPVVFVVALLPACSGSSEAGCNEGEREKVVADQKAAAQELTELNTRTGLDPGARTNLINDARRNLRLRVSPLGVFAEQHPGCFSESQRAELVALGRQATQALDE